MDILKIVFISFVLMLIFLVSPVREQYFPAGVSSVKNNTPICDAGISGEIKPIAYNLMLCAWESSGDGK